MGRIKSKGERAKRENGGVECGTVSNNSPHSIQVLTLYYT
jgi:hypothetical protein